MLFCHEGIPFISLCFVFNLLCIARRAMKGPCWGRTFLSHTDTSADNLGNLMNKIPILIFFALAVLEFRAVLKLLWVVGHPGAIMSICHSNFPQSFFPHTCDLNVSCVRSHVVCTWTPSFWCYHFMTQKYPSLGSIVSKLYFSHCTLSGSLCQLYAGREKQHLNLTKARKQKRENFNWIWNRFCASHLQLYKSSPTVLGSKGRWFSIVNWNAKVSGDEVSSFSANHPH